ncbi:MAG: hypothetical protein HC913_00575 [Microscillaceae bacterium]|nr:hypothetical protein [Microscillaceae bacterium]
MFKLRFNSIKTRVRLFFFANIVLVIFNYFYTVYVNYISERDRQYLEISKESEKYIERISFRMASIIENPEQEKGLKVLLKKDISNYRDNIEALDRGGDGPHFGRPRNH